MKKSHIEYVINLVGFFMIAASASAEVRLFCLGFISMRGLSMMIDGIFQFSKEENPNVRKVDILQIMVGGLIIGSAVLTFYLKS